MGFFIRYIWQFCFSPNQFLGEVLSSQIEESPENKVVNLCRSTRVPAPFFSICFSRKNNTSIVARRGMEFVVARHGCCESDAPPPPPPFYFLELLA